MKLIFEVLEFEIAKCAKFVPKVRNFRIEIIGKTRSPTFKKESKKIPAKTNNLQNRTDIAANPAGEH